MVYICSHHCARFLTNFTGNTNNHEKAELLKPEKVISSFQQSAVVLSQKECKAQKFHLFLSTLLLSRLIEDTKITKQTALGKHLIQAQQTKETALVISYDLFLLLYLLLFVECFMRVSIETSSQHHLLGLRGDHVF